MPSPLEITLSSNIAGTTDVIIEPETFVFKVGDKKKTFRVSASTSALEKFYYISWNVQGDLSPTLYTPVVSTEIYVFQEKKLEITTLPSLIELPVGG